MPDLLTRYLAASACVYAHVDRLRDLADLHMELAELARELHGDRVADAHEEHVANLMRMVVDARAVADAAAIPAFVDA